MREVPLKIHGMDCADEVVTLKKELAPVPGVQQLDFNILQGRMVVTYDPDQVDVDGLIAAVRRTGMRAETFREARAMLREGSWWDRWSRTALTSLSGIQVAGGFLVHALSAGWQAAIGGAEWASIPFATRLLYLGAVITGAWYVAPKAWRSLLRLRPDMNLLMTVAVFGAILIGELFEAATVAFLFAVSLALESWSVSRARKAVAALMALAPPQARIIGPDGNEQMIDVAEVEVGGKFVVKPGEKVPLDGRITAGQTSLDQSPITGESMPVSRGVGDEIFAGSINQEGAVEALAVKPAEQSTISQIIKMVDEAQSKRSPSEQWVETFARYYTPAVLVIAIVVAVGVPVILGNWSEWFYQALVLLVIACPCALVISTPVSIVAALAAAARNGVLIKGGLYVELPGKIKAVALDKTGTLTEGRPKVSELVPLSGHSEAELLKIATAIELRSEHPLARAIVQHAANQGIKPAPVEDYQAIKGKGATALLSGSPVWLGSHRYLEERGEETPEMHAELERLSAGGRSVVVIGEGDHVCGFISLADQLRSNTRAAVAELKSAGVENVTMLTGDNQPTAAAIARASGVDDFRAELLPQEKVTAVEDLLGRYHSVAMIGDGVNDAPALARASLGVAMGAIGSDAALETADIALMSDDLSKLPWLIHHSRRTLRVIRQNIWFSLAVKAAFVILTLVGQANLWTAIAADMGASLLVVANGLRLLRQ